MLKQFRITVKTTGRGTTDITPEVNNLVKTSHIQSGLCHVFIQHTSASLIVCENADPQVLLDLEAFMQRLVPDGDELFQHNDEGIDDMPAHVRMILTQTSLNIPIVDNKLALGRWQGLYLWEHRLGGYERHLIISVQGND